MEKMVGYCGLVCTECEAYIATVANDLSALEKMAAQARDEYGVPNATADSVRCMGCLATDGPQCGYCFECAVRACGIERSVPNCAHCADYACEKLESFWGMASGAKVNLDAIRASLAA
jgi:hypothetical protein